MKLIDIRAESFVFTGEAEFNGTSHTAVLDAQSELYCISFYSEGVLTIKQGPLYGPNKVNTIETKYYWVQESCPDADGFDRGGYDIFELETDLEILQHRTIRV